MGRCMRGNASRALHTAPCGHAWCRACTPCLVRSRGRTPWPTRCSCCCPRRPRARRPPCCGPRGPARAGTAHKLPARPKSLPNILRVDALKYFAALLQALPKHSERLPCTRGSDRGAECSRRVRGVPAHGCASETLAEGYATQSKACGSGRLQVLCDELRGGSLWTAVQTQTCLSGCVVWRVAGST